MNLSRIDTDGSEKICLVNVCKVQNSANFYNVMCAIKYYEIEMTSKFE